MRVMWQEDRREETAAGLDTEASIALADLEFESKNKAEGFAYVPSPGRLARGLISNLPSPLEDLVFVDYGSGKGRVLLVASEYPFKEIVGVEFSRELHDIACSNISRYVSPAQRCRNVRAVHGDATEFAIPAQDCVLYFNNPFAEPVMAEVLANVAAAHEAYHKRIFVLYQQLRHEPASDRTENLAMIAALPFLRERRVSLPSLTARVLLGSHSLRIFESVS